MLTITHWQPLHIIEHSQGNTDLGATRLLPSIGQSQSCKGQYSI